MKNCHSKLTYSIVLGCCAGFKPGFRCLETCSRAHWLWVYVQTDLWRYEPTQRCPTPRGENEVTYYCQAVQRFSIIMDSLNIIWPAFHAPCVLNMYALPTSLKAFHRVGRLSVQSRAVSICLGCMFNMFLFHWIGRVKLKISAAANTAILYGIWGQHVWGAWVFFGSLSHGLLICASVLFCDE